MQSSVHDIIDQLQSCALELLKEHDGIPLSRVVTLHRDKYGLAVNEEWAGKHIEHNGIVKVVEVWGGQKFVEIP